MDRHFFRLLEGLGRRVKIEIGNTAHMLAAKTRQTVLGCLVRLSGLTLLLLLRVVVVEVVRVGQRRCIRA